MRHDRLPDTGFLSGASAPLRQMLESQASDIRLSQGEVLFEQGDTGDALYAIIEGALEFSILSIAGRKLTLDLMRPGAVFGEIALFDPALAPRQSPPASPAVSGDCATGMCWLRSSNIPNWPGTCCDWRGSACAG